jgi:hypothetical protein
MPRMLVRAVCCRCFRYHRPKYRFSRRGLRCKLEVDSSAPSIIKAVDCRSRGRDPEEERRSVLRNAACDAVGAPDSTPSWRTRCIRRPRRIARTSSGGRARRARRALPQGRHACLSGSPRRASRSCHAQEARLRRGGSATDRAAQAALDRMACRELRTDRAKSPHIENAGIEKHCVSPIRRARR